MSAADTLRRLERQESALRRRAKAAHPAMRDQLEVEAERIAGFRRDLLAVNRMLARALAGAPA